MTHYLVYDSSRNVFVFLLEDPVGGECPFEPREVDFEGMGNPVNPIWHAGAKRPIVNRLVLGESSDEKSYRLFKTASECEDAEFKLTGRNCFEAKNWKEYLDGKSIGY